MLENYEHYITDNIKNFYKRRLATPIVYLISLIILWNLFSLTDLLAPGRLKDKDTLETAYRNDIAYVRTDLNNLRFTGYTQNNSFGRIQGYYYYTLLEDDCIIALLTPATSEQGLPLIEHASVTGKIMHKTPNLDKLLLSLSSDLNWTENGISNEVSLYYISEPDYSLPRSLFLFGIIFLTGGYALVCILLFLLYIRVPVFSPACQNLSRFGNPGRLLAQAEEELATLPQLATEDMFITEHFFIETSVYGNAVIPIAEIIWIYKYSTLHKFFWYHFSISYTLHISAKKHLYIQCPKNTKSDIDGIIDYLAEANHKILVGFNEENRLKVEEIQGTPMHIKKILDLLNRRV